MILNLLECFDTCHEYKFFVFTDSKELEGKYKNIEIIYIDSNSRLLWDYWYSCRKIKDYSIDVIFYPKNIIPISHFFLKSKKINMIMDLAHFEEKFKSYKFFDTVYMKSLMGISCNFASHVLAISHNTKSDIVNKLNIDKRKITVVPLAVSGDFKRINNSHFLDKLCKKYLVDKPFLFYCGSISPRKNLLRLFKAYCNILDQIPHNFYMSVTDSWGDIVIDKSMRDQLKDRLVVLPHLEKNELIAMYSLADAYLYPSLYEGFGLPILEAQACGCPVLTSNVTSCPEVAGEGALFVDPYSIPSIQEGLLRIVRDLDLRDRLIKLGFENLKRFSWEKSAEQMLDIAVNQAAYK